MKAAVLFALLSLPAFAADLPIHDDRLDFSLCTESLAPRGTIGCLGTRRDQGGKIQVLVVLPAGRGTYDYYRVLKKEPLKDGQAWAVTVQSYMMDYPPMDRTIRRLRLTRQADGSYLLEGPAPYGYDLSIRLWEVQ